MILVYCESESSREAVARLLGGLPTSLVRCRRELENAAPTARCVALVSQDLSLPGLADWLHGLISRCPGAGWILVTRASAENADALLQVRGLDHLIWEPDMDAMLWPAVVEILDARPLTHLANTIKRAPDLAPELIRCLTSACLSPRPIRTEGSLARTAGLSERRLRQLWRSSLAEGSSPKELLDWILVCWALRTKSSDRSWSGVAAQLGVKEDTLRAACSRRTGRTLGTLLGLGRESVRGLVLDWWSEARAG